MRHNVIVVAAQKSLRTQSNWGGKGRGARSAHMTEHGMMQHWQSSPHQHGFVTGGRSGILLPVGFVADEVPEVRDEEAVELGIVPGVGGCGVWVCGVVGWELVRLDWGGRWEGGGSVLPRVEGRVGLAA
ncbi:hypothetical protein FH972_023329 [Carpinus fangiana]|uniref:Uncharacterized protein n=1 Tax=Carpinus fangiana TaxID=176857 RepID=A0A5N6KX58_9ROSI|nr:hypothetical protein FH972_023329 [Carpinus fangiana]